MSIGIVKGGRNDGAQGGIPWYLNSDLYTVYDAFASDLNASRWDIVGDSVWSNSSNAGGDTAGEANVTASNKTSSIESNSLPTDVNQIWCRLQFDWSGGNFCTPNGYVNGKKFGTGSMADAVGPFQDSSSCITQALLIRTTGTNDFDVYVGGKNYGSVTMATPVIKLETDSNNADGTARLYVDDVRYI